MAKMTTDFLSIFNGATAEDLEAIRARQRELEKELSGLAAIEKALNVRLNGKAERKTKKKTAAPETNGSANGAVLNLDERRRKVVRYLMANGSKSRQKVAEANGIGFAGRSCITEVLNCKSFHVTPDGMVTVTGLGEESVKGFHGLD